MMRKFLIENNGLWSIIISLLCGVIPLFIKDLSSLFTAIIIIITVTVVFLISYLLLNWKKLYLAPESSLTHVDTDYTSIHNKGRGIYWYYGLSSSGMQSQNTNFLDFFKDSKRTEVKILLCHPACSPFKERVSVMNRRDAKQAIEIKTKQIEILLKAYESVSESDRQRVEIRFSLSPPIWVLQFINENNNDSPDTLYLKYHLKDEKKKESDFYYTKVNDSHVFEAFKYYFESEWNKAIPLGSGIGIPEIKE